MTPRYHEPDIRPIAVPHLLIKRGVNVRLIGGPHIGGTGVVIAVRKDRMRALIQCIGLDAGQIEFWAPLTDFEAIVYADTNFRRKRSPRSASKQRR